MYDFALRSLAKGHTIPLDFRQSVPLGNDVLQAASSRIESTIARCIGVSKHMYLPRSNFYTISLQSSGLASPSGGGFLSAFAPLKRRGSTL